MGSTKAPAACLAALALTYLPVANAAALCSDEILTREDVQERGKDDATWVLTSAFVILTMQSGFAALETGMISQKFAVSVMLKNVIDVVLGGLAYWLFGYGLAFGENVGGLFGRDKFAINMAPDPYSSAVDLYSHYIFQFAFSSTATTIMSGAVAGRMKFKAYMALSFLGILTYSVPVHWTWHCDGWLRRLDFMDFAGGGPVHVMGGTTGLVAAWWVGPREGRLEPKNLNSSEFAHKNPVGCVLGLFMLWWGWLGLNCGSTFGVTGSKWLVAGRVAVTTVNASIGGGWFGVCWSYFWREKGVVNTGVVINSILSALVAITAGCASVSPAWAVLIGVVGALLSILTNDALLRYHILDDVAGTVGVHCVAGLWGVIALGLFAEDAFAGMSEVFPGNNRKGLFYGGGLHLFGVQTLGAIAMLVWSAALTALLCLLVNRTIGLRGSDQEIATGFDVVEHGLAPELEQPSMEEVTMPMDAMAKQIARIRVAVLEAKVTLEGQRWELEAVKRQSFEVLKQEENVMAPHSTGAKKALPHSSSGPRPGLPRSPE